MKGLLLKDWYMVTRYCRSLLLIDAVFIAASLFAPGNVVFLAYPCLFAAIVPMTLFSYDDREKWSAYSAALPVSRAQIVSVKYMVGLLSVAAMFLVTVLVHEAARIITPDSAAEYLPMVSVASALSFLVPAVVLPLMFRFGAEKARVVYFIMIGVICAASFIVLQSSEKPGVAEALSSLGPAALCAAALVLYGLSWLLSVSFYKRREL